MTTNREWLERLAHDAPDELAAWFDAEHVEPNDWKRPESDVKPQVVAANGESVTQDSRKQLEDDIDEFRRRYIACELRDIPLVDIVRCWLDRQAAITYSIDAWYIEKLKDERDELKAQVEQWMDAAANAHDMWEKADTRRVKAERERDEAAEMYAEAFGDAETYRRLFGRALDLAGDISALGASLG